MRIPKLETVANIVVMATCVAMLAVLADRAISDSRRAQAPDAQSPDFWASGKPAPKLVGVDYGTHPMTLVMYINSQCRFCTASMPLYQKLSESKTSGTQLRLVAASTEPAEIAQAYLRQHDVSVDAVVSVPPGIPTPTLVLVDRSGTVRKHWVGQQDEGGAESLLQAIGLTSRIKNAS
jgi:peroxiredoxin